MRDPKTKPELLAPAGDFDKLRFAFAYGADAVYAGLPMFSLRTRENKFDLDGVRRGIEYAHGIGKKVYITANIYAHNTKIEPFLEAMDRVVPLGADAYILSDPGLIDLVKERHPEAVIHLSTQANNTNWAQARFWRKLGVSRVILARELNLEEIREIAARNPELETEAFVHGAMCMAYSGRCMLSDHFTGRPSNSGACTQSCRWEFGTRTAPAPDAETRDADAGLKSLQDRPRDPATSVDEAWLEERKRPGELIPVEEDEYGTYIFNSKDLCAINLLPRILAAGVESIKIEGRNKNFLYLATVVRAYRQAIDACFDGTFDTTLPALREELEGLNQRGYTEGFFLGPVENTVNPDKSNFATRSYAGKIVARHPNNRLEIEIKHKLTVGDEIEWLTPRQGVLPDRISRIWDGERREPQTISAGTDQWNPSIETRLDLDEFALMRVRTKRTHERIPVKEASLYEIPVDTIDKKNTTLGTYKGKVLLIVNTASQCGLTPQYEGLEKLFAQHREKGLMVLGFPCNQFGGQEPGTEAEIQGFCDLNYKVSFPLFSKIEVNGTGTHPLYQLLKSEGRGILNTEAIKWNFTKFLVGRDGTVIKRFAPTATPEEIEPEILKALGLTTP